MAEKQYLVSVADALLFDPDTDNLTIKGKALLNSSIEQSMQNQEVFAGRGSQLQFEYNYQKVLNISIEAADFAPAYLAMQTGSTIKNELSKYFTEEDVVFDGTGNGILAETPVGNAYVELPDGNLTVIPTGKNINIASLANKTAKVVYQYNTTVDVITIPANTFPKAYRLVLTSDVYGTNGKTHEMQVEVPKYKLDGAISLSLQHDQVGSFTLNGKSLADKDNNYAYVKFKPLAVTNIPLIALAATPSEVQLDSATTGDAEQLTVYGLRGGLYTNIIVDSAKLTFSSDDDTIATVDATGKIELGASATSGQSTVVRITDGTHTDVVQVEIL